jgi:hypothetical protein
MTKARAFFLSSLAFLLVAAIVFAATEVVGSESHSSDVTGCFVDATEKLGIRFQRQASLTSKKYLLEAMGSGVALFDYDSDGISIFSSPMAHDSMILRPKAAFRRKTPKVLEPALSPETRGLLGGCDANGRCRRYPYSAGVAVGDDDNDGFEDLYVTGYGRDTLSEPSWVTSRLIPPISMRKPIWLRRRRPWPHAIRRWPSQDQEKVARRIQPLMEFLRKL